MSSAGPWSVKGIDARAREIAKDQARRSGQTLGEWLNARIIEDAVAAPPAPVPAAAGVSADLKGLARALDALSTRMESAEKRSADAVQGVDRKLAGVLRRLDGADADAGRKLDEVRAAQAELADRLGRTAPEDHPRREALKALEQALGKVAAQIYESESRSRGQVAEVRGDLASLSTRMDAADARAAATAAAESASIGPDAEEVERRFADMAGRLAAAEQRTTEAVRALEGSFAGLDRRMAEVEARPQEGVTEQRFERLAAELHERVETARADMAERIRAAAGGGLERMEEALRELAGDVAKAEKRQVGAIDTMGREVVRIAQTLNGRMGAVEDRQNQGEQRVGAEVGRMADIVENRLREGDEQQAQALERLGGEIARIAETLAERIGASERRSAQTAEDAFEHLRDVSERLNARHETTAAEVDARIRSAEERTADLLASPAAASTVDPAEVLAAVAAPYAPAPPAWEPPPAAASPFVSPADAASARAHAHAEAAAGARAAPPVDPRPTPPPYDPFAGFEPEPEPLAESFAPPPEPFAFGAEPAAPPPADPFSAITREEAALDRFAAVDPADDIFDAPPPSAPARASTRELIDQARAAAREAAEARRGGRKGKLQDLHASTAASSGGGMPSLPWAKKREASGTVRTAVVASLVASSTVALAVGAASLAHGDHTPATTGEAPTAIAAAPANATDGQLAVALTAPDPSIDAAGAAHPHAASLSDGLPADAAAMAVPTTAPASTRLAAEGAGPRAEPAGAVAKLAFGDALRRIEAGDATGVTALKRAANLGYAPAQLKLASLYEQGAAGLPKDVAQARTWTQRAAVGGDPHAQFNLGMFFANGDGGLKNDGSAAAWFRRAADSGLHDAQFNLAVMSQTGRGVPQNLPEAYKWYLVAASQGDTGARQAGEALKAELSPDQQSAAERAAAAFRTQVATAQVKAAATN